MSADAIEEQLKLMQLKTSDVGAAEYPNRPLANQRKGAMPVATGETSTCFAQIQVEQ